MPPIGSITSCRSGESIATRPPASGNWARMFARCDAVMVQITSACRVRFSVSGWLSWPERSAPRSRIASRAPVLALPPPQAAIPALATTTPCRSISSGRHPNRSAISSRKSVSAIGLRQVLPVQTKSTIRLESRRSVSSETMPGCTTRKPAASTAIVDAGWAYLARPSSITRLTAAPAASHRATTSAAVTGGDSTAPAGSASTTGPASIRMQSASIGWPGTRSRSFPEPTISFRTPAGSRCTRLSRWSSSTMMVTGPGQHRRDSRWPSGDSRGAQSRASSALLSASDSRGPSGRSAARRQSRSTAAS